jgi:hypothetical protein
VCEKVHEANDVASIIRKVRNKLNHGRGAGSAQENWSLYPTYFTELSIKE